MLSPRKFSYYNKAYLILMILLWALSYDIFYDLVYLLAPGQVLEQMEYALLDSLVCLALLLIYGFYYDKMPWREKTEPINFTYQHIWQIPILGLAIGGLASLWFSLVDWLLTSGYQFPQTLEEFDQSWDFTVQDSYLWVFLSVIILGPVVEELLFRGIIYDYLQAFKRPYLSILVSALLFALWHRQPVQIGYTFFAGIVFATARYYSGDLLYPMIIHVLNNLLSTLPDDWYDVVGPMINNLSYLAIVPAIYILWTWYQAASYHSNPSTMLNHSIK